jgi:hypothetical protein
MKTAWMHHLLLNYFEFWTSFNAIQCRIRFCFQTSLNNSRFDSNELAINQRIWRAHWFEKTFKLGRFEEWTSIRDWTSIWIYHICMYMSKWSPLYTYTFGEEHAHMVPCIWWNMYFNIIPLHFIHLLIWWSTNLLYPPPSICFPCIKDWNLKYVNNCLSSYISYICLAWVQT